MGFYLTKEAKFPVFWASLRYGEEKPIVVDRGKIPLEIAPGTYDVRVMHRRGKELRIGQREITGEAGRTYYLDVAAEEGP